MKASSRSAVCSISALLDERVVGVEAAHVQWHSHRGPCWLENGVALCTLHHKALDLGPIGMSEDHLSRVSSRLSGGGAVEQTLLRYQGQPLRLPQAGLASIHEKHSHRHLENVFKQPVRAA
jgi:putative restriction endonuclease